jgi:hypothetical protein
MRKPLLLLVLCVVAAGAVASWWLRVPDLSRVGVGYAAQQTCACLFISGRTPQSCGAELDPLARRLVRVEIGDHEVAARSLGSRARARFTAGLGCSLVE